MAIKFPADGASRLYAYVHWLGCRMERGYADGYGYDKRSAAVAAAICKINPHTDLSSISMNPDSVALRKDFIAAAGEMDSQDWTRAVEKAGFVVWQAV